MSSEHNAKDSIEAYAIDSIIPNNIEGEADRSQPERTPARIIYKSKAGIEQVISLNSQNSYHKIIYHAFSYALRSEWFGGLGDLTKVTYCDCIRHLASWLNEHSQKASERDKYIYLKEYESYLINRKKWKNSPLGIIKSILREGICSPFFSEAEQQYLKRVIAYSPKIKPEKKESRTLTSWFTLPWLRDILGDSQFLKLESPQRLILSFRITIAVTLLYLLDARDKLQKFSLPLFSPTYKYWQYDWNELLFEKITHFDNAGFPVDQLSSVFWEDCVKNSYKVQVRERLIKYDHKPTQENKHAKGFTSKPWQVPVMLHPAYKETYSPVEELLLAWLAACEAIQPSDISKLKTSDYAREVNASGRLVMMQCVYYKGRSGAMRHPAILMAEDPWTKALVRYIDGLPTSSRLFRSNPQKTLAVPSLGKKSRRNTFVGFLFNLWKTPELQKLIDTELKRYQAPGIFLKAIFALEEGSVPYDHKSMRITYSEYKKNFPCPMPHFWFSLTHIKTSTIHAKSDSYRDEDLINHHSHTSKTEKINYLTDSNKEWVNSCGRITRLVLHDLRNVVFQASIESVKHSIDDLVLRTKVIQATGTKDSTVHTLQSLIDASNSDEDIIVSDSLDTALYFIHYISQAELMLPKLLTIRPYFVEKTLLIKVEWMTRMLSKMQKAKSATAQYEAIRSSLPPMFDHLLETAE